MCIRPINTLTSIFNQHYFGVLLNDVIFYDLSSKTSYKSGSLNYTQYTQPA